MTNQIIQHTPSNFGSNQVNGLIYLQEQDDTLRRESRVKTNSCKESITYSESVNWCGLGGESSE